LAGAEIQSFSILKLLKKHLIRAFAVMTDMVSSSNDSLFNKAGKRSIEKQFCRDYSICVRGEDYGPHPRELQEGRDICRTV